MARKNSQTRLCPVNGDGYPIGEQHHCAKVSDHDVDLIMELREGGMPYGEIAEKFELSRSTVWDICNGKKRAQIPQGYKRVRIKHKATAPRSLTTGTDTRDSE